MKKVLMGLAVTIVFIAGCNRAEKALKTQIYQRQDEMNQKFHSMMQEWLKHMTSTIPKERTRKSLLKWRLEALKFPWQKDMDAIVAGTRGLSINLEYNAIRTYFQEISEYWNAMDPNSNSKKRIKIKDFLKSQDKLLKALHVIAPDEEDGKKPVKKVKLSKDMKKSIQMVLAMADFDKVFLHALAFYGSQKYKGLKRSLYMFKFWQLAFDFPRKSKSVDRYIRRLCKEKLSKFCSKVPFEVLGIAINKPYYERVRQLVADFAKKHADCKLKQVFDGLDKALADAEKAIPEFKEDPVLADTISEDDFTSNLLFVVSRKQGIVFNGKGEAPNVQLVKPMDDWEVSAGQWKVFAKKLDTLLKVLGKKRGPENMEWALLMIDKDAPVSIAAKFVKVMAKNDPRYLSFGGRRRMDGIAKAAKVGRLVFREVPLKPMTVTVAGRGKYSCSVLGQSNTNPRMDHNLKKFLLVTQSTQYLGDWSKGKARNLKEVSLQDAAKAIQKEAAFIAIKSNVKVNKVVALLSALGYKCEDKECEKEKTVKYDAQFEVCTSH